MTFPGAIKPFDRKNASREEYAALNRHRNRMRRERLPNEPPTPLEQTIRDAQSLPPFADARGWAVWNEPSTEMLAVGSIEVLRTEHNQHVAEVDIDVLPEARRRRLATRLLKPIVDSARAEGRRLLIGGTNGNVPAGEAFMNRLGATPAHRSHINELDLGTLDRELLARWRLGAQERAAGFELREWIGRYPEEQLATVVAMLENTNLAPRDDLDVEDFHWTPQQLRENDDAMLRRGAERWTLYARHRATGEIAGFTEVYWNPVKPDLVDQGWTSVSPAYRNRGLGRWLKGAMIEKILADRPTVTRIHTGNADSNAAMLSINRELGFKPYLSHTYWQIPRERVEAYLEQSGALVRGGTT